MLILSIALAFGVIVFLLLLRNLNKSFKQDIKGSGSQKILAIVKLILLVEVIAYLIIFTMVFVKTLLL